MVASVTQSVRARLITCRDQDVSVPVFLHYRSVDPLAVHLEFSAEVSCSGDAVIWSFARELLGEGLFRPAGVGDVHVWPCGPCHTILELYSPEGMALLQFDTLSLRHFLLCTYSAVSRGQEDVGQALEHGLTSLLDEV